jgi:hypothetical protein
MRQTRRKIRLWATSHASSFNRDSGREWSMPTKADGLVPPPTPRSQRVKLSNESGQGQGVTESSPERGGWQSAGARRRETEGGAANAPFCGLGQALLLAGGCRGGAPGRCSRRGRVGCTPAGAARPGRVGARGRERGREKEWWRLGRGSRAVAARVLGAWPVSWA